MQAAWTTAALGRVKKMPKLDTLTIADRGRPRPTSSWQQMYASAAAWASRDGEIRTEGDAP